ncbi:biotin/lipoyl-containing protein [Chloroflexota bacterium]
MKYQVSVAGQTFEMEVLHHRLVQVNGQPLYVDLDQVGGLPLYSLSLDDEEYLVFVDEGQSDYEVEVEGRVYKVGVESQFPRLPARRSEGPGEGETCHVVTAPLAGHLISLPVAVGQGVEAGQVAAVIESMKMEMKLRFSRAGVVEVTHVESGQDVQRGDRLVTFRPE